MITFFSALIGLATLLLLRIPLGFSLGVVGFFGYANIMGLPVAASMVAGTTFELGTYSLTVIPLFILMGNLVSNSGLGDRLFKAAYTITGRIPGSLSIAAIVASGGFAAISGSSIATAATMAKVSYPPMRNYKYEPEFALAAIAAGGTLGILIPPSVMLIVYGILAEENISKLFIAGIVPGLLGIIFYVGAGLISILINPQIAPSGRKFTIRQKLSALFPVWGVMSLFLLVIGGMYLGVFTATEGAGIGCFGALVLTLISTADPLPKIRTAIFDTVNTTGVLFPILLGSLILGNFIAMSGVTDYMINYVDELQPSKYQLLILILLMYIILGCFFESFSTLFVTLPLVLPLVEAAHVNLIWFGIMLVMTIETGLLTPPFGMNVFVIAAAVQDKVSIPRIFRRLVPFIISDMLRILTVLAIPALALWLPSHM